MDDAASKIQYALPMLLGALAHLPHRKEWRLQIAASIHDCDNLKQKLIDQHHQKAAGVPRTSSQQWVEQEEWFELDLDV